MAARKLNRTAWLAVALQGLYHGAEALCSIFVGVYLWINSLDFMVVCTHYIALYTVTPIFFVLSGWYSQTFDRLHVYRLGLVLHAVYYGTLLTLREQAPDYVIPLGILLGITWGVYWAGSNTFNYDVTRKGKREYYFGLLQTFIGSARLLSPLVGGLLIDLAPTKLYGYHLIFGAVIVIYLICFGLSFFMPHDRTRRPFNIRRALFPSRDQRDWRLILAAAVTLAGAFNIFSFLLGLLMYMQTEDEVVVGGFASFMALISIITAYTFGRFIVPRNRGRFLFWGMVLLVLAGLVVSVKMTVISLFVFGLLRGVAGPLFSISHFSLRLDTISESAEEEGQRIEYLCAWEVPLAIGRVLMMLALMGLYAWSQENDFGLRMALLILCGTRVFTYLLLSRTSLISRHG